jgi:predicted anti-sigma-YlaC factor YlaD
MQPYASHWRAPKVPYVFSASLRVGTLATCLLALCIAGSGTGTFAQDNDPELIRDAAPFSLKLIESLLSEVPKHQGLLLAAASGFTQYSYAFVQQSADQEEDRSLERAAEMRVRARHLYLRARDYGLRGLEVSYPGFSARLREDRSAAVRALRKADVGMIYWTGAAWASAITVSKDIPEVVADLPLVEALMDRALEFDPAFGAGALHSFFISYEPARTGGVGDPAERSRRHFDRAVELSKGRQAGPYVALAEAVSIRSQNAAEFRELLQRALAVDVDADPNSRLVNVIMQRRAEWLLSRMDELFLELDDGELENTE